MAEPSPPRQAQDGRRPYRCQPMLCIGRFIHLLHSDLMISACGGSCAQRGRPGSWAASALWLGLGGGIALPQFNQRFAPSGGETSRRTAQILPVMLWRPPGLPPGPVPRTWAAATGCRRFAASSPPAPPPESRRRQPPPAGGPIPPFPGPPPRLSGNTGPARRPGGGGAGG